MKFFCIAMLFLCLTVSAFAEPLSFRDIKMGMKKEDLYKFTNKDLCLDSGKDYCCRKEMEEIYGTYVTVFYCMLDENASVDHIWMSFYNRNFDNLRDALIEKYGKNYKTNRPVMQNLMGAKIANEISSWKLKNGTVSIDKYGIDIEKGTIEFIDNSYFKRGNRKQKGKGF